MLAWLKRFLFCAHKWVVVGDGRTVNGFSLARCDRCGRKRFICF